jgi:hypothetical protein
MLATLVLALLRLSGITRTMQDAVAILVLAVPVLLLLGLFSSAFVSGWRRRRQDRRKIVAEGRTAQAVVTKIVDSSRNDQSIVYFSYQPTTAGRNFDGRQSTTKAAIELLGITVGSTTTFATAASATAYAWSRRG